MVRVENPPQNEPTFHPQNYQTGQPAFVGLPWSTQLFDCHLDQNNAIMTAFFPCVTFGQIAEVMDQGELSKPSNSNAQFTCMHALIFLGHFELLIVFWGIDLIKISYFHDFSYTVRSPERSCPMGSFIYLLMMPALCSQWLMGSKYRNKLRARYHLVEAPYQDVISHIFCACCSLCQEYRELKIRGLDPSQGWNGILAQMEMQRINQTMNTPPPAQNMST